MVRETQCRRSSPQMSSRALCPGPIGPQCLWRDQSMWLPRIPPPPPPSLHSGDLWRKSEDDACGEQGAEQPIPAQPNNYARNNRRCSYSLSRSSISRAFFSSGTKLATKAANPANPPPMLLTSAAIVTFTAASVPFSSPFAAPFAMAVGALPFTSFQAEPPTSDNSLPAYRNAPAVKFL
jgi:hypothetical protein